MYGRQHSYKFRGQIVSGYFVTQNDKIMVLWQWFVFENALLLQISLSVTVLLALTVFLLLVAETLPTQSESVPLIGMLRRVYRVYNFPS